MATQSPVNFFTINANKNSAQWYNAFNDTQTGVQNNMMEQNIAPSVKTADLDEQLRSEGLKIESPMAQEAKQSYVDSLSEEQYGKMLWYKNAWYSFEASKALLKAEEQVTGWWYRGEGFQAQEPLGGTFLNALNPVWLAFEKIDDWIQEHVTDFDDWDDESYSFLTTLKNIPGSALKTASATARWLANPVDTMVMLVQLLGTSEGRDIIKQRYGSWDWILNTLEKDPVWLASDVLTIVQWGASIAGTAGKLWATGAKLAGKASTASKLANFWTKASKIGNTAGILADLWISIPYNNLLDSTLTKLANGGKLSQRAGQYLSMTQRPIQTIFKGANPTAEWGLNSPGIQDKVSSIIARAKENISSTATGLTQEVKDRIRNNPYVGEYRRQTEEKINTEGASLEPQKLIEEPLQELGNELLKRLDDYEKRLEENWPAYQRLKATTQPHDLSPAFSSALDVFSKNQISLTPDGTLRFANMILPSDMNPITTAWQLINKAPWWQMTVRDYLNLRSQLTDLAKFESGTTTKGTKVIKELRNQINKVAHKEIPGLEKVDWLYSKQTKELQELRKGLVYQQGSRKWETRDNFYSIIKNMNTANRGQMRKRLSNIFPDLEARAEAINMLPKLANAYQNSPQMMKTMFKATGALAWLGSNAWAIRTAMWYIVGLVLDEFLWKPLGEKWRKLAIDKLLQETTPEAQQLLAEVASKVKAGIDLTANERATLEQAISEIIGSENEYLDGQRLEEWERENRKLRLPEPKPDVAGENGIKLWEGRALRQPEPYNLKKERTAEVKDIQEDLAVDEATAEKVSDSIEDFLDEVWAYDWQLNPREVNYSKFSTKSLNELYESDLPRTEKEKIGKELEQRQWEESIDNDEPYYAYKIRQLEEEEQRIGKVGKNKVSKTVADQQSRNLVEKREKLIKELEQVYFNGDPDSANKAAEKYAELRDKPLSFIEQYTKSSRFPEEQAERIILDRLQEEWSKQPKFTRQLSEEGIRARNELINSELNNWYKFDTNDYNDRYIKEENWQIVDRGSIKYDENGKIEVIAQDINWLLDSWLLTRLPKDAEIRVSWETESFTAWEVVWDWQYQKAWVADPNERTITAEEWLSIRNFKNWRSVREIMKDYGVSEEIVDKIVTEKGEQALWRYKDQLIELASLIKEGTAPHELFHAVFDLVDNWRKEEILKIVQERKWMSRKDANEWLADRFSEYFRTGKFDTKTAPKWLLWRIRAFFDKVRDFVTWVYRERAKVKQLFDDILDNKIETDIERDMVSEILYNKNEVPVQPQREGPQSTSSSKSLTIDKTNSSQFKNKFDEVKEQIRTGEVTKDNFLDTIKEVIKNSDEESEYVTNKNTDEVHTLRVSDHHAKSWHAYRQGHPDNNTSVVIKMFSETRWWPRNKRDAFQRNRHVDMKEFAYDTERLTPEKMESIIDSINNWIDNWEWSDKNYNKFKESVKRDPEAEYQITQESLFAEPKKQFTEKEMNDAFDKHRPKLEAVIDRIWTNKNRNIDYPPIRIAYSILESYSPDVNKWIENINNDITLTKRKWITPGELTWIYHALEQFMKDPEMKAWVEYNNNNNGHLWKQLFDMMKNMENNPLEIPEEYKMSDSLQKLNDTLYDNLERATINNLIGTYDPDPIEWKYNVNKALKETTSEYLTLSKLYNIKNMVQDYINESWDKPVAWTFDDVWIQKLVDLEKKWKEQKVSSFDNEQITKVWEELWEQLVKFNQDTIDVLWDMYNSDVDKWQSNLEKVKSIRKQYSDIRVPHTNTLTTLKSKLVELSKYSPEEIREVFWEDDQASKNLYKFVKEVRDKEAKLEAEWTTKAVTNLVALHNMDIKNLERQIKNFNGKSPMPSIAVMDPNVPHEVFGDLTLIFWKDTINPKVDERNKIYGSDAWTPMFPDIEEAWTLSTYAKRHQAIMEIIRPNKEWLESKWVKRPENFRFDFNQATEECLKDYSWRKDLNENADRLAEQIMEDIVVELEHSQGEFLEWDIELYERIEDWFYKMFANASTSEYVIPARYFRNNPITLSEEDSNKLANELTKTLMKTDYAKKWLTEKQMKHWMNELVGNLNDIQWNDRAEYVWQRIKNIWIQLDTNETLEIMANINKYAKVILQDQWNIKDRPLTPENVVEAMKNQRVNREVQPWSFRDMIEIEWHELNDVEDVRRQNFAKVFHWDWTGDLWNLEHRYDNLIKMLAEENDRLEWNPISDWNVIESLKYDIKTSYDTDVDKFKDNLLTDYPDTPEHTTTFNEDVLKRIIDVVEQGKKVPIRFSESKPERVVDLYKEVQYVLVPSGDLKKAQQIVKWTELEWKLVEYTPDNHTAPRSRKIKELQKRYWNIFFQMWWVVMPIAMLLQAVNNIQWDDEGTE